MTTITRSHLSILTQLAEHGGSADLNVHGCLVAGPLKHMIPGDSRAWLLLVSHGLVAGERGKLFLTEEGRVRVASVLAGLVREAG